MPAAFPTGAELVTFMANLGITIDSTRGGILVTSALQAFEDATGWHPFLAGAATTYYVEAMPQASCDGYRHDLELNPVLKATTPVVSWVPDVGDEVTLTDRTDYHFMPLSAGLDLNPFVILRTKEWKGQGRLKIVAKVGFTSVVPQSAYDAVMQKAAQYELDRLRISANASNGGDGLKLVKSGAVTLEWFQEKISSFNTFFSDVAQRYSV
jgi:hypothetical protein